MARHQQQVATFNAENVTQAVKAVTEAGVPVSRVEINAAGDVIVVTCGEIQDNLAGGGKV